MKKLFALFAFTLLSASAFATAPGESASTNIPKWTATKEVCERIEVYGKYSKDQCLILINVRDLCKVKPRHAVCYRTARMIKPHFLGDKDFEREIAIIQDYMKKK